MVLLTPPQSKFTDCVLEKKGNKQHTLVTLTVRGGND